MVIFKSEPKKGDFVSVLLIMCAESGAGYLCAARTSFEPTFWELRSIKKVNGTHKGERDTGMTRIMACPVEYADRGVKRKPYYDGLIPYRMSV